MVSSSRFFAALTKGITKGIAKGITTVARTATEILEQQQRRRDTRQPGFRAPREPRRPFGTVFKPKEQSKLPPIENTHPGWDYPGDYEQLPKMVYHPIADDYPDPGEVVWSWVPYEEDFSRGKDRPVLIIGHDGADWLLALQLTSKDHDKDEEQEARAGRYWFDIGPGPWDKKRRPSEARVNRILRIHPSDVRRIGGRVTEQIFSQVAQEVRKYY